MALAPPRTPAADPWAFLTTPKFKNFAGNALADLGFGLTRGTDFGKALGAATERTAQMQPSRDAEEAARLKLAEAAQKENATLEYLKRARPDLAEKVAAGMPVSEAWGALMKPPESVKPIEINGQLVDPNTYQVLGDFRTPEQMGGGKQPASVQEYEYAKSQGFTGSFTEYQTQMKQATRGPMSATIVKELFDAEDSATAGGYVLSALDEAVKLNDAAYDGPGAKVRGGATGLFGNAEGQATLRLDNLTTELALTQLKTIFGGMPTEGERKILIELQGSVDQPKAVRADIFKRARMMAERRIEDNKRKAAGLRSGDYFEEGYGQSAPPGGQTSGGVSWSVE